MFLRRLVERNPPLATTAVRLHQEGRLRANTYLIDLDALHANAIAIREAADAAGVDVYFMAKQFGRNPDGCRAIVAAGVPRAVAVDLQGMEALSRAQVRIGHVGHLVQPHRASEDAVLAAKPEVVTVFSLEVAERLGKAAERAGRTQDVLMRVTAPGDVFYFGHGGGFPLDGIERAARTLESLPGISVAGVTTFPCLLADADAKSVKPTPNFATLAEAAERLRAIGFDVRQVNAPGTTSAQTMQMLRHGGATHVEPGNAFHGTTPMQVFDSDAPELPAIVYVSEVSHVEGDVAYAFAAGLYIDRVLGSYPLRALCGRDDQVLLRSFAVETAPDGAIHYYCTLRAPRGDVHVGDTVVFCYRPQTFVTRARTRGVSGVSSDDPQLGAVYDEEAREVQGVA